MNRRTANGRMEVLLAPRLIPLLLLKIVALSLIWLLFVRGQQVPSSERDVAASFGLGRPTANLQTKSKGASHGQ